MQQHSMPHCMAAALLRHGAQFTWQQLQDAAASLVPGLQVWAELSRALGVQLHASVPRIAAALCCGDVLELQSPLQWDLPADTPPGTLSSRRSALLPGLTQLAVALPRAGGATAALAGLCSLQEAAGLDCSTVAGLLNAALQMRATERVMVLLRLPAVQQLDQATALQLLQHAVDTKLAVSVQQLCSLPVLQAEYDSSQSNPLWSQLWSSALVTGAPAMLRALSQLPAVRAMQQLDAQALLPLLHAAVRCQHSGSLGWLCKLPAAADITSDDAAVLLQVAVDSGSRAQVAELLQLQGVQTLTPANVQSLHAEQRSAATSSTCCWCASRSAAAAAASRRYHPAAGELRFEAVLALPAARRLDSCSACSLLHLAVLHPDAALLAEALCETAGGQADESDISSLLAGAVTADSSRKLEALVRLPAAKSLAADALLPIAAAAARSKDVRVLPALLNLPAAAELPGAACNMLLRASVDAAGVLGGSSHAVHVNALCKVPGAAAASTNVLLAAVQSVISTSGTSGTWDHDSILGAARLAV
uniref:Uncharacterized protein n=1 Tax=Tetradesmus obliquus TaxID=3088 RepID=A0A383WA84_TETOB|eukprot:jgi/Sobl393_1/2875/SZX74009.1